jgi:hypothetical protein
MPSQGFSVRGKRGRRRGFATTEVLVGVLIAITLGAQGFLAYQVVKIGEQSQTDYRQVRDSIEGTNKALTEAIHHVREQQAVFGATIAERFEKVSSAVEKKKR